MEKGRKAELKTGRGELGAEDCFGMR